MDISELRLANLTALMAERDLDRKQLANLLRKEPGQINHWWMSPEREGRRGIGPKIAREIEAAFDRPRGWLDQRHGNEMRERPAPDYSSPGIPIIGFAIATPDEDGYFDDMGFPPGSGEAYVPWPTKDPNAYGLRVRGDSMQPRIRPGQIIVVEPNTAVSNLDDVVVHTRAGRKMVKQLLARRGGEVTLGSINQAHRQTTISLEEIESIHFVAAIVSRSSAEEDVT